MYEAMEKARNASAEQQPDTGRLFDPDRDVSSEVVAGIQDVTSRMVPGTVDVLGQEHVAAPDEWVAFGKQVAQERVILGEQFDRSQYRGKLAEGHRKLRDSLLATEEDGAKLTPVDRVALAFKYGRYASSMRSVGLQPGQKHEDNQRAMAIFKKALFEHEDPDKFLHHATLMKQMGLITIAPEALQTHLDGMLLQRAIVGQHAGESPEPLQKQVLRTAWKKYLGLEADYTSLKDDVYKQLDADRDRDKMESFAKLLVVVKKYCGDDRVLKDEERDKLVARRKQYENTDKWVAHVMAQREQGVEALERWKNYGYFAKSLMQLDVLDQAVEAAETIEGPVSGGDTVYEPLATKPETQEQERMTEPPQVVEPIVAPTEINEYREMIEAMPETAVKAEALRKVKELLEYSAGKGEEWEVVSHSIMQKLFTSADYLRELVQPDTTEDLDVYDYQEKLPGNITYHLKNFDKEYKREGKPEHLPRRQIKLLLKTHLLLKRLFGRQKKKK